jgi:hypothetical protein
MTPAPSGNQFWKLRSKHGRDKLFKTPELLWDAACEYFQWCIDNPFEEELAFHAQGIITKTFVTKLRPFTMQGLTAYLDCNTVYFNHFETSIKDNTDKNSKDFCKVVTRIRETIYNQKFSGAASGFFNANIIARDLGLQDKSELAVTTQQKDIAKKFDTLFSPETDATDKP